MDLQRDESDNEWAGLPQICSAGSNVYVVYVDLFRETLFGDEAWHVVFNRSKDGGRSWLPEGRIIDTGHSTTSRATVPRIACSGETVYVVYMDSREGRWSIFFNRSLDGGDTWLASDVDIASVQVPNLSGWPEIACEDRRVHVVWHLWHDESSSDVVYRRSEDAGETWAQETLLDFGPYQAWYPRISARNGTVVVVWTDGRNPSGSTVYLNRSVDGGRTWLESDFRLDTGEPEGWGNDARIPEIYCDGPYICGIWRGQGAALYARCSRDGGESWLPDQVRLSGGAGWVSDFTLAGEGPELYVAWTEYRTDHGDVFFQRSSDGGQTWLPVGPRVSSEEPGDRERLSARIAVCGPHVYVVWTTISWWYDEFETLHGDGDIVMSTSADRGENWIREVRIDTAPDRASAWNLRISLSESSLYAVWEGNYGEDDNVWFNGSHAPPAEEIELPRHDPHGRVKDYSAER